RRRRLDGQSGRADLVGAALDQHRALVPAVPAQHDAEYALVAGLRGPRLWRAWIRGAPLGLHLRPARRAGRRRDRRAAAGSWIFRRDERRLRLPGLPATDLPDRHGGALAGPALPRRAAELRRRRQLLRPARCWAASDADGWWVDGQRNARAPAGRSADRR